MESLLSLYAQATARQYGRCTTQCQGITVRVRLRAKKAVVGYGCALGSFTALSEILGTSPSHSGHHVLATSRSHESGKEISDSTTAPAPPYYTYIGWRPRVSCLLVAHRLHRWHTQLLYGLLRVYFYPSRGIVKALGVRANQDDLFKDLPGLRRTVRRHVYMLISAQGLG
jgi:hypothetical protein